VLVGSDAFSRFSLETAERTNVDTGLALILRVLEANHAADRREMREAVASGRKTARQVQEENPIIPLDAKVEINWQDLSQRLERTCALRQSS